MQKWQTKAAEILPEMKNEILESETPMQLWIEIVLLFDKAYEEPRNEGFIKRVYEFQDWCLEQNEGETADGHLLSSVAIIFWEHIPTNTLARQDMPRWFTLEDVLSNKHYFGCDLTDENFNELVNLFPK